MTLPNLQGVDELLVTTVKPTGLGTQMVGARKPYAGSPVIVDPTVGLIPYVVGPVAYTPATVTWTEDGPGTADAVVVTMSVARAGSPALDAQYVRAIIAPHAGPSLTLPVLPGPYAIYNLTEADDFTAAHGIATATGGYAALRTRAFAVANVVDATPVAGSVTLSYAGTTPPVL